MNEPVVPVEPIVAAPAEVTPVAPVIPIEPVIPASEASVEVPQQVQEIYDNVDDQLKSLIGTTSPERLDEIRNELIGQISTEKGIDIKALISSTKPFVAPIVEAVVPPVDGKTEPKPIEIKSPIFGEKPITIDTPEVKLDNKVDFSKIENLDQVNETIKSSLGIDNLSSLVASYQEMSGQIKDHAVVSEESKKNAETVDRYESIFTNMDPQLFNAVSASIKGESWKDHVSEPLDYSKGFADNDTKAVLDLFFPGKVTEEDLEEYNDEECDPRTKRMVDSFISQANVMFDNKKQGIQTYSANLIEAQQKRSASLIEQSASIVKDLPSKIVGVDAAYSKNIGEMLVDEQKILSLFYDKEGNIRPEAGLRLTMAQDGQGLYEQTKNALEAKITTQKNEELLRRSAGAPPIQEGRKEVGKISKEDQKQLDELKAIQRTQSGSN